MFGKILLVKVCEDSFVNMSALRDFAGSIAHCCTRHIDYHHSDHTDLHAVPGETRELRQ